MSGEWFYFGCGPGARKGHYLHGESSQIASPYSRPLVDALTNLDGLLGPVGRSAPYIAALSRLGGAGYSALSWWDHSVDDRPGSNSIIYAPGLTISAEDMLDEAQRRFPWVFSRLPRPVVLLSGTGQ